MLVSGLAAGEQVRKLRIWIAVLVTLLLVLTVRAVPTLLASQLGDLTFTRPFFY